MKQKIEALLFISTKPLSAKTILSFLKKDDNQVTVTDIENSLKELQLEYNNNRGMMIVEAGEQYQMVTAPQYAEMMKRFLRDERTGELTQPSLETLTIIAYRGPISKPVIEQIRGVNCSLILRNLLIRDLIVGEEKENDIFYSVTPNFLQYLGLSSVLDLPEYEKLHTVENLEQFLANQAQNNINKVE